MTKAKLVLSDTRAERRCADPVLQKPHLCQKMEWLGFGYAAIVAAGGIVGYVKAGLCC